MPKTKKSLGQHWLFDKPSLHSVIDAAQLTSKDTVLEIGPGRGPLTELLSQNTKHVFAIEKDASLIPGLSAQFALNDNVGIVEGDILNFDLTTLPKDYKVVANIPYYITGKILQVLLQSSNPPSKVVLLIQKEVAERIVAAPGQLSVLAISVQLVAEPKIAAIVTRDKFQPPPKVDSAIIVIDLLKKPKLDVEHSRLMRLVKAGFSNKRKTLRNSLAGGLHLKGSEAEKLLLKAKVSPGARAQELSLEQWKKLYDVTLDIY